MIFFIYSIEYGFQYNSSDSQLCSLILIISLPFYIIQILLNLNIGYYYKDEIVKDRSKIFNNYKATLLGDILSIIGLIYN